MEVNLNVQEQETLFYYYSNWQAYRQQHNKIHNATCGYCCYGTGMHENVNRGENGVWIGPFSSLELCVAYVENTLGQPANTCNTCTH